MDTITKQYIDLLPESPFELTKSNIKKIHTRIPVPNDFKILWADISSLNGYPSGVVITDRALIYKTHKALVKEERKANIEKSINQRRA